MQITLILRIVLLLLRDTDDLIFFESRSSLRRYFLSLNLDLDIIFEFRSTSRSRPKFSKFRSKSRSNFSQFLSWLRSNFSEFGSRSSFVQVLRCLVQSDFIWFQNHLM